MTKLTGSLGVRNEINVDIIGTGARGKKGKSAYEIWLDLGNEGTEQEYLASLKGDDGYTPIKGVDYFDGIDGKDGEQGIQGVPGNDGYTPIKGVDYFDGIDGKDGNDATVTSSNITDALGYVPANATNEHTHTNKSTIDKFSEVEGKLYYNGEVIYVGYTDDDIVSVGVEVDFANRKFERLAGAIGKTPGADFDSILAFGGRRRCNVTNEGKVIAYYGDAGYSETGKLTQAITIGEGENAVTYPVDTIVQVMVEQPKFYYKVVPLKLERVINGKGYHLRKARYYVSDTKLTGFKVHPAFIHNKKEKNFIYLSAYEGSIYDKSAEAYLLADEQIADFTVTTGDKLSSIAYAKPASGLAQRLTRSGSRIVARNRGIGWEQAYAATVSATQLLFTVEYASMNTQNQLGYGVLGKTDDGATSMTELTGATTNLGNESGHVKNVNGYEVPSYRGEENWYGNIWKWVDGLNIEAKGLNNLYVANENFADDIGTDPYKDAGITIAKANGYISAFAYNEEFDWLFFASETLGNDSLPVGDYLYQNHAHNGWLAAILGGTWSHSSHGGGFFWIVSSASSDRYRNRGGRLVYVPDAA